MKKILISGANGFIAGHLAKRLKRPNFRIIGISRLLREINHYDYVYEGRLMTPLKNIFEREHIDVFIHCANYTGDNDYQVNVDGTKLWAEQAKANGVRLQIFMSSISAKMDSLSSYGRAKYCLENWFVDNDHVVLRLGLVIGNGGLFRRMVSMVKKYPLIPLLDNGKALVYITGIEFLCDVVKDIIMNEELIKKGRIWNLFQPNSVTLKAILDGIKKECKTFCVLFPFPSSMALKLLRIFGRFPFRLGISSNNIIGLRQNDRLNFDSDFERFGYPESQLGELIKKAI
ncbi:MAG: NAD(P)-dependent oxidoreductase [Candidatus Aminicenantes bacterium]|nr:NAD(P)-dependent oxidoreductase [Candidatus Aminicenantes bacterium]